MRRGAGRGAWRRLANLVALATLAILALPAVGHAYEVQISITGAGQVTETTPANLVGSSCKSAADTPTGVVGRTCSAGTTSGDYGFFWEVDYLATPSPGYSFVRWQTTPGHGWSPVICDRSDPVATGSIYTGASCKFRTTEDLQTRAVFADVTPPPTPTVSSAPEQPTSGPVGFTFSGTTSDPTFSHYICQVEGPNGGSQPDCADGTVTVSGATSGQYTLSVRAVDHSDNWSGLVQRTFTVDRTPPDTMLSPGTGPVPGSRTNSTSAAFAFTTNDPGASFRCELDNQPLGTCTSPRLLTGLADGPHRFEVQAVDRLGNVDLSPAVRQWTVDTVAPETTLHAAVGPPEGSTTDAVSASFSFTSSEPGGFRCFLDGVALGPCGSPFTAADLDDGPHTFQVQAMDTAGNLDGSPPERRWTVVTAGAPQDPPAGEPEDPPTEDPPPADPVAPSDPTDAGDGNDAPEAEACRASKRKLAKAKARLRKLRKADAAERRIDRAERKVKRRAKSKRRACPGR